MITTAPADTAAAMHAAYFGDDEMTDEELVKRLLGTEITAVRANRDVLGVRPIVSANDGIQLAADRIEALQAENATLRQALADERAGADALHSAAQDALTFLKADCAHMTSAEPERLVLRRAIAAHAARMEGRG